MGVMIFMIAYTARYAVRHVRKKKDLRTRQMKKVFSGLIDHDS